MNTNTNITIDEFFIEAVTQNSTSVFKFTMSKTGVLDYIGEVETFDDSDYQQIDASTYFSPSWYTYLPKCLQADFKICYKSGIERLDHSQYSFLMHIGALLLAVKERDGLLAAELLSRRTSVFTANLPLVSYIIKPIATEALFAWMYGRFSNQDEGCNILYEIVKANLQIEPHKETLEQSFTRYFKENSGMELTIGIVGSQCHFWTHGFSRLESMINHHVARDFTEGLAALREARQKFFDALAISVQAEPYNPHDKNAISVSIEDIEAKITGSSGKTKAGYIRATGAEILRNARPEQFAYKAKLWRVGNTQDSKYGVVVKICL